jgi:hypothetical protein
LCSAVQSTPDAAKETGGAGIDRLPLRGAGIGAGGREGSTVGDVMGPGWAHTRAARQRSRASRPSASAPLQPARITVDLEPHALAGSRRAHSPSGGQRLHEQEPSASLVGVRRRQQRGLPAAGVVALDAELVSVGKDVQVKGPLVRGAVPDRVGREVPGRAQPERRRCCCAFNPVLAMGDAIGSLRVLEPATGPRAIRWTPTTLGKLAVGGPRSCTRLHDFSPGCRGRA